MPDFEINKSLHDDRIVLWNHKWMFNRSCGKLMIKKYSRLFFEWEIRLICQTFTCDFLTHFRHHYFITWKITFHLTFSVQTIRLKIHLEFYICTFNSPLWFDEIILTIFHSILGHIQKTTIGRPDFANSADLELHATQRPKTAVGGQQKTSQTVVAQLSETQVSWRQLKNLDP